VQSETSNAINNYIETGTYTDAQNPCTIADSISVRSPANLHLAARAVKETNGITITVSDEQIRYAQKEMFQKSGIFAEPAASAPFAGYKQIAHELESDAKIVLLVTGHGLKDIESIIL